MRRGAITVMMLSLPLAAPLAAQEGSRLTNAGVVRATAQVDSVFQSKTIPSVTIDGGDFTAYLLARIGVPSFADSSGFRISVDTSRVHITGKLLDFPAEKRKELGALLFFVDSTATIEAEISMPQSDYGIMRLRLERLLINGVAIPDVLLIPLATAYGSNYKELSANGREFQVGMPTLGKSELRKNQIRLFMRPAPPIKR